MNVKQYLNQVRLLDKKINQRIEEKEYLMGKATSTGSSGNMDPDKVQGSLNLHKNEELITKYIDLEHEIDSMINQFVDLKHKIIGQIQQLEDVHQVDCLMQRYVDYNSFELIAVNMGYSIRRIYQIHGDALQAFKNKHCI